MTHSELGTSRTRRAGLMATALVAAMSFALTGVVTVATTTVAIAAAAPNYATELDAMIAAGEEPGAALRQLLADSVCSGQEPGPTTAALITAAQAAGIPDAVIGAGLGSGATLVEDCNPDAAEVVAQVIANMGTRAMRQAFVNGVAAGGGSVDIGTIALAEPTGAFDGVTGFGTNSTSSANPCDNPSCN